MTQIGDVLADRYRLVRLVGRGGMSDVYEADDRLTNTAVAIKLVRSGDPEFARRLDREVRALESLEHPGLIRLLDTGVAGDQAFLVMDYVDGPTLATSLREGPLGTVAASRLGAQLADALAYVHARGLVHRDVKPSNILRSSDGDAWLGDFGIALMHDATTITALGIAVGTVTYMAPEQLEGHSVGAAADVWSLGVVLLECLTGRRVFEGSPSEVVARRLRGPVTLADDLPAPWKMLLASMLQERPEARPSSAEVASLLATAPFQAPWQPATLVAPALVADGDETRVVANETRVLGAGALLADADQTVRAPAALSTPEEPERRVAWWGVASILVLALVGLWALTSALGSSAPTTASTSSTVTTSVATGTRALATLLNDLASAQSAQTLDAASAQSVTVDARQALVDWSARNFANVQNDLQQAATTMVNAQQLATATPSAAALIQSDIASLATSLGVAVPSTTTTTTTTAPVAPPPGPGLGHGKGH